VGNDNGRVINEIRHKYGEEFSIYAMTSYGMRIKISDDDNDNAEGVFYCDKIPDHDHGV
jgi:hypothetical protein